MEEALTGEPVPFLGLFSPLTCAFPKEEEEEPDPINGSYVQSGRDKDS